MPRKPPKPPRILVEYRQARFVQELIKTGFNDPVLAAKRAGYAETSAHAAASRLLQRPHVLAKINGAMRASIDRIGISSDMIVTEMAKLAFHEIDHETPSAVVAAKRASLVDMARIMGLMAEKREISGPDGGALKIENVSTEQLIAALDTLTGGGQEGSGNPARADEEAGED